MCDPFSSQLMMPKNPQKMFTPYLSPSIWECMKRFYNLGLVYFILALGDPSMCVCVGGGGVGPGSLPTLHALVGGWAWFIPTTLMLMII